MKLTVFILLKLELPWNRGTYKEIPNWVELYLQLRNSNRCFRFDSGVEVCNLWLNIKIFHMVCVFLMEVFCYMNIVLHFVIYIYVFMLHFKWFSLYWLIFVCVIRMRHSHYMILTLLFLLEQSVTWTCFQWTVPHCNCKDGSILIHDDYMCFQ